MPRTPTTLQRELEQHYCDAPTAAGILNLDKSHVCAQLRAGRFPGAFRWGSSQDRSQWIIPLTAVHAYRETLVPRSDRRWGHLRHGEGDGTPKRNRKRATAAL